MVFHFGETLDTSYVRDGVLNRHQFVSSEPSPQVYPYHYWRTWCRPSDPNLHRKGPRGTDPGKMSLISIEMKINFNFGMKHFLLIENMVIFVYCWKCWGLGFFLKDNFLSMYLVHTCHYEAHIWHRSGVVFHVYAQRTAIPVFNLIFYRLPSVI